MNNIANKVVIITGASSGIGEATAYKLAEKGAKLVLGARREDKLKTIVENIKSKGGESDYGRLAYGIGSSGHQYSHGDHLPRGGTV